MGQRTLSVFIADRNQIVALVHLFAIAVTPAAAQQSIKVLTPNLDTCAAFTAAMDSGDRSQSLALGSWALGFLSGVAQSTGIDILRNATTELVMKRLYHDCREQPAKPMSLVLEEMVRTLVANQ